MKQVTACNAFTDYLHLTAHCNDECATGSYKSQCNVFMETILPTFFFRGHPNTYGVLLYFMIVMSMIKRLHKVILNVKIENSRTQQIAKASRKKPCHLCRLNQTVEAILLNTKFENSHTQHKVKASRYSLVTQGIDNRAKPIIYAQGT